MEQNTQGPVPVERNMYAHYVPAWARDRMERIADAALSAYGGGAI